MMNTSSIFYSCEIGKQCICHVHFGYYTSQSKAGIKPREAEELVNNSNHPPVYPIWVA